MQTEQAMQEAMGSDLRNLSYLNKRKQKRGTFPKVKKGTGLYAQQLGNTFGYEIEERRVIASDRRERGNLIKKIEIAASLRSSQ